MRRIPRQTSDPRPAPGEPGASIKINATMTMTSAQYLTLEEFLSSPSSLPTILHPRSHALRLVHLCELAEMTPPPIFLNFLFQPTTAASDASATATASSADANNDGDAAAAPGQPSSLVSNGNYNGNYNRHILVTQMALLLYLGEYTHAQHLWSRHASATVGEDVPFSSSDNATNDCDYVQLEKLWNAAKYMSLWNTGGMHNNLLPSFNQQQSNNFILPATTKSSDTGIASMQIENKDDELKSLEQQYDDSAIGTSNAGSTPSSTSLPYSTLALRALRSCQTSNMEPLATYATELLGVFRSRINQRLHKYVAKLDLAEFRLRMNYVECNGGTGGSGDGEWVDDAWIA
ncbi:hypothetical protein ACHAXH_000675, partial [Discostella pseudostelligera]